MNTTSTSTDKRSRAEYQREWAKQNRDKRNQYRKNWMAKHPETHREYSKQYRESHKEQVNKWARECYLRHKERRKAEAAEYRKANRDQVAKGKRVFFFGKAGNEYYCAQLRQQGGRCAICERTATDTGKALGLDHNHAYDAKDPRGWRGLLCRYCNAGIGNFQEDVRFLGGPAREYVERWAGTLEVAA